MDVVPVDVAVRAIVRIAGGDSRDRIFHLCNPQPTPVATVIDWLRTCGIAVKLLPYPQWRDAFADKAARFEYEPLLPLLPEGPTEALQRVGGRERRFASDNVQRALVGSDISLAPVTGELFARYLDYLARKLKLTAVSG